MNRTAHQLRFAAPRDWGNPIKNAGDKPNVAVLLTYPDQTVIRISFDGSDYAAATELPMPRTSSQPPLKLATIDVDETRLAIHTTSNGASWEVIPTSDTGS